MKLIVAFAFLCFELGKTVFGHPASGIVVTEMGEIYFVHTRRGVGKVLAGGRVDYVKESTGGHWMCLDEKGIFSRAQPKHFERITSEGISPAIIFADGGSPIAVGDRNLYYVSNDEKLTPGGLQLTRETAQGMASVVSVELRKRTEKLGITGLGRNPQGEIFVACPNSIFKLMTNGNFVAISEGIELEDCDVDHPDGNANIPMPALRGIAADARGNIYAAATGCHRVIKIREGGKAEVILKSERPWSPTGLAVGASGEVFVLEYTNANGGSSLGWYPRVRKIGADGKVTTLVNLEKRNSGEASPE